ncbi:putative calcineurin-like phosphoesterase [Thozetella sp. PMI_491]|nr:putative calcineurin-like phosphoesterase [Thozetella sp. PMI_491]
MKSLGKLVSKLRGHPEVQLLSDLHLEVGQQYSSFTIPRSAPFLLLAGDIGRLIDYDQYLSFLQQQVANYKVIFLVLGNHEFYETDYDSGLAKAQALVAEPSLRGKVVLLHKTRWDDPNSNFTILGCTLWSAIADSARDIVRAKVKDFKKITDWSVEKHNALHADEVAWLKRELQETRGRDVLIATHHAPSLQGTSSPQHVDNPWTSAFATDVLQQGTWEGVGVWAFGHTHFSADFMCRGVRIVSNQRGYILPGDAGQQQKGARKKGDFDPAMVVIV